jgi:hypothetical protein
MIELAIGAALLSCPIDMEKGFDAEGYWHEEGLTKEERDKIWLEIHLCIKKMYIFMEKAEEEAKLITDIDVRDATVGAIEGAIAGFAGLRPYSIVVGACLGTLGRIAGSSYIHFVQSKDYVKEAAYFADRAQYLENKLWRNGK